MDLESSFARMRPVQSDSIRAHVVTPGRPSECFVAVKFGPPFPLEPGLEIAPNSGNPCLIGLRTNDRGIGTHLSRPVVRANVFGAAVNGLAGE